MGTKIRFGITLSTSDHIDAGMQHFVNQLSYIFSWHGDGISVLFR